MSKNIGHLLHSSPFNRKGSPNRGQPSCVWLESGSYNEDINMAVLSFCAYHSVEVKTILCDCETLTAFPLYENGSVGLQEACDLVNSQWNLKTDVQNSSGRTLLEFIVKLENTLKKMQFTLFAPAADFPNTVTNRSQIQTEIADAVDVLVKISSTMGPNGSIRVVSGIVQKIQMLINAASSRSTILMKPLPHWLDSSWRCPTIDSCHLSSKSTESVNSTCTNSSSDSRRFVSESGSRSSHSSQFHIDEAHNITVSVNIPLMLSAVSGLSTIVENLENISSKVGLLSMPPSENIINENYLDDLCIESLLLLHWLLLLCPYNLIREPEYMKIGSSGTHSTSYTVRDTVEDLPHLRYALFHGPPAHGIFTRRSEGENIVQIRLSDCTSNPHLFSMQDSGLQMKMENRKDQLMYKDNRGWNNDLFYKFGVYALNLRILGPSLATSAVNTTSDINREDNVSGHTEGCDISAHEKNSVNLSNSGRNLDESQNWRKLERDLWLHGTAGDCIHALLSLGPRPASNSRLQTTGEIFGRGVYLTDSVAVAASFSKPAGLILKAHDVVEAYLGQKNGNLSYMELRSTDIFSKHKLRYSNEFSCLVRKSYLRPIVHVDAIACPDNKIVSAGSSIEDPVRIVPIEGGDNDLIDTQKLQREGVRFFIAGRGRVSRCYLVAGNSESLFCTAVSMIDDSGGGSSENVRFSMFYLILFIFTFFCFKFYVMS